MRNGQWWAVTGLALGALALPGTARAEAPVFSKDIAPILRDSCSKCHNARQPTGGFSVTTFASLEKGGKSGKLLAPKAADSKLVKLLEGTAQPKMPPGNPLPKAQIDKIKAWIDAGGKSDVEANSVIIPESAIPAVKVPVIALKVPMLPQVGSLAWSTDGKILAIGTYKKVKLVDPTTGQAIRELDGEADVVHDLRFSRDGKMLAAAGGLPAQQGEIKIWDVATGNLIRTITGHNDFIFSCSWGEGDKTIASASYDKLIKIWDVATGNELKTLKDHADAVYAVAFNPAGNLLASGSADRSVKVWDPATGKRLYTLAGHADMVFSLAWNKAGNQITSVGADKSIRTWNVNPQSGNAARNNTGHDKTVHSVAYSDDGSMMATASDDKTVKVWTAANGGQKQVLKDFADAMLSVALSPDGKQVATGSFDGSVKIFNVEDGKLISTPIEAPKMPEPAAAPAAKPAAPAKPAPKAAPKPLKSAKTARSASR